VNFKWKHDQYVNSGDNIRGKIHGVGDIGREGSVIIKDVLLVDGLKHNLMEELLGALASCASFNGS